MAFSGLFPAPSHKTRFRSARFTQVIKLIDAVLVRQSSCSIIDIGGLPEYWSDFSEMLGKRRVEVTIINFREFAAQSGWIKCLYGDATNLSQFSDNTFDVVHSNSTIEHVGSWQNMEAMAAEVRRLAPVYYVQTPNFWFPYEFHAGMIGFHWLPRSWRASMLMRHACGFYKKAPDLGAAMRSIEDARCLTRKEVQFLFPDAVLRGERFLGLNKSWIASRA